MTLKTRDKKYMARDNPPYNIKIIGSEGSYLIGDRGKKYIDFTSGWCVGNMGWGDRRIEKVIKNFKGPNYVSPNFLYEPWVELAALLASITPGELVKSFRATGGTEAVDIALRAANAYTQRHKFISIEGSYHGDSIGAMSVGTSEFREHQKGLLFRSYKIKPPLNEIAADKVEAILKREEVAALIMEPIICNLAVLVPEQIFMNRIQKLCKKYGTLLIIDEVATGFYRTGKLFGAEHFKLQPDIMCFAKAITGGYAPMGATIATAKVAQAMEFESSYYSTYGWNPLSVDVALANLQLILQHRSKLEEHIKLISDYFRERLSHMQFRSSVDIRIVGLAIGIKFKEENYSDKIVEVARKKGLLVSLHSETEFNMFPPLTLQMSVAKKGLDILEKSI